VTPRVLFLTTSYPLASGHWSGVFVHRQAVALRRLGVPVTVLAPGAPDALETETIDGVPIHRFPYLPRDWQTIAYGGGIPANLRERPELWAGVPFFAVGLTAAVRRLAAEHDLVHAHWSFCGAVASPAWVRHRRPLVVSFHGSDLAGGSAAYLALARRAASAAAGVVVHSGAMRDRALAAGVGEQKLLQVAHGIDVNRYTKQPRPEGPVALLAVGRLAEEKGFDLLVEAVSKLAPTIDWTLRIVGEGPDASSLAKQVEQSAGASRITLTGPLSEDAVRAEMEAADVLVVPSRREGFSVVTLEGMAAGLAVVGTRVGALPNLVVEGESGFLAAPGEARELTAALTRALEQPSAIAAMGRVGRQAVAERFDLERVNKPLVSLYESLAEKHERREAR
jgi:glycosyltransferase involved in cell wall biosynthesis